MVVNTNTIANNKILYIYKDNTEYANDYKNFLENKGYSVSLINMNHINSSFLTQFDLIIIGADTGVSNTWSNYTACLIVFESARPIIGISGGGASFFDNISLKIGWGECWIVPSISTVKSGNISGILFNTPNTFKNNTVYTLYSVKCSAYSVYVPNKTSDLTLIGREESSTTHYPVIMQNLTYVLWGIEYDPINMTYYGLNLFINIVNFLIVTHAPSETVIPPSIPGFELIVVALSITPLILVSKKKGIIK